MKKIKWFVVLLLTITTACTSNKETEQIKTPKTEENTKQPVEQVKPSPTEPKQPEEQATSNSTEQKPTVTPNETKPVNGNTQETTKKLTIQDPENILSLVTKKQLLPSDYIPKDLSVPNVVFSFGDAKVEKRHMRKEAADALEKLFKSAKKDKINLAAVSGYRSYKRQEEVYNAEVKQKGAAEASRSVAYPGESEHQTGLAMDVSAPSVHYALVQSLGDSIEGKWLAEHAHEYGFIIRYPQSKENITEYKYEPWHLRYVGVDVAKIIYENGFTLEEYFSR